jgi:polyphosphate kinase
MKRNLESRVEVLVPVDDSIARQRLRALLDLQLAPNRNAWDMQSDGDYVRTVSDGGDVGAQMRMVEWLSHEPPSRAMRRKRPARIARRSTV